MSRANTVSESEFQTALMNTIGGDRRFCMWRQLNGNLYWCDRDGNFHPVKAGPPKGAADLTGYVFGTGRMIQLEVKSASGRMLDDQVKWSFAMKRAGVIHHVAKYDPSIAFDDNVQLALEEIARQAGV